MSNELPTEARPGALRVVEGCDDRQEILITQELSDVTDQAAAAIARDEEIFQRGGALVHVVTPTPAPGASSAPSIRDLPVATLHVRLAQVVRWLKVNAKGNHSRVAVPSAIIQAVHSRGQWDAVRPLVGVLTAPTMRPDGSVLQVAGYDRSTALLLWPSERFVEVPDKPSKDDARGAAAEILDLVCDFPFATDFDRSAWLAGALTLVGRHAIAGPCPLFAISGNTRGSGKSRLVDCAVKLAHGTKAARSSLSGTDEEQRKQITALLAEGTPSALLDNVKNGVRLGSPAFDALLTSDVWKDRLLGKIQNLTLPARTVWWATGNNLRFAGDLPRRTLCVRLDSPLEDPEDREGFKHGEGDALLEHVAKRRKFLVAQALIILRAHAVAGRPACGRAWGSFESWSSIVAAALRWLDLPDPLEARATEDESADEERMQAASVIAVLEAIGRPVTARELVAELYPYGQYEGEGPPDPSPTYAGARETLEEVCGGKGHPDATRTGYFLRRMKGRVIRGACLYGAVDEQRTVRGSHRRRRSSRLRARHLRPQVSRRLHHRRHVARLGGDRRRRARRARSAFRAVRLATLPC
jgi:hypothetical protein